MRITVAAGFEAGARHAHVLNTVGMARALSQLGHKVSIICRAGRNAPRKSAELSCVYGLDETIRWRLTPRTFRGRETDVHWEYAWPALAHVLLLAPRLVFARNYVLPTLTARLGIPTVAESHAHVGNRTKPFLTMLRAGRCRGFKRLVTIAPVLADYYAELGFPQGKLMILPDGADLVRFSRPAELPPAPFSCEIPNAVYAGHLYDYKGIPTVLDAAKLLPQVSFHFVGGLPDDIERHKRTAMAQGLRNVVFHGMKKQEDLPPYLWYANVLLLPPSAGHPSAQWTSPMKLGEYLASGTPVVATSIPALRNWVSDIDVVFAKPDDARSLAEAVKRVINDEDYAASLSASGKMKAEEFSFVQRATSILKGIV